MRKLLIAATLTIAGLVGVGYVTGATTSYAATISPAAIDAASSVSGWNVLASASSAVASSASRMQVLEGTVTAMTDSTISVESDADGSLHTFALTSTTQYSLLYDATTETTSYMAVGSHVLVDWTGSSIWSTPTAARVTLLAD